jgi:hypothetical protein
MRQRISIFFAAAFIAASCQSSSTDRPEQHNCIAASQVQGIAAVKFETIHHDFGYLPNDTVVSHRFTFANTGEHDLILQSVKASCGCTVPQWTKEPIAPGQAGFVEVAFSTKGRSGKQIKTVTVRANTEPESTRLKFFATIGQQEGTDSLNNVQITNTEQLTNQ